MHVWISSWRLLRECSELNRGMLGNLELKT